MAIKFPVLYLGYGSNTNRREMRHRCPTAKYVGNAVLKKYRLIFRGVADVVADPRSNVHCSLWELRESDLRALDAFEGYPNHYGRRFARLRFEGRDRVALFYFMAGRRDDQHEPPRSYESCLREGYVACGMPTVQIDEAVREAQTHSHREKTYRGKWVRQDMELKRLAERPSMTSDDMLWQDDACRRANEEFNAFTIQDDGLPAYMSAYGMKKGVR